MTKDTIILESIMEKEFVLIGGSHHLMVLNKSGVPEHRLVFPNLKKLPKLLDSDITSWNQLTHKAALEVEYYDLKEYEIFGKRRFFYVLKDLSTEEANRLILSPLTNKE